MVRAQENNLNLELILSTVKSVPKGNKIWLLVLRLVVRVHFSQQNLKIEPSIELLTSGGVDMVRSRKG